MKKVVKGAATISVGLALTGIATVVMAGFYWIDQVEQQLNTNVANDASTQAQVTDQGNNITYIRTQIDAVNTNLDTLLLEQGIKPKQ